LFTEKLLLEITSKVRLEFVGGILIVGEGIFDGSADESPRETQYDFAPPSRLPKRKFNAKELNPLIIVNKNISRSAKFINLFSVCLWKG
jgi:hypothetical protein